MKTALFGVGLSFVAACCGCTVVDDKSGNDGGAPPTDTSVASDTGTASDGDTGTSTDAPADTTGPVTIDTACATWAANECALMDKCTPFDLLRNYGDIATCAARNVLLCKAKAAAPGIGANFAADIQNCSTVSPSCNDFIDGLRDASCTPAGTLAKDAPCLISEQCGAGLGCARIDGPCGSCLPIGKAGDPCSAVGADNKFCGPGTFCHFKGTSCVAFPAEGEPCIPYGPTAICANHDYCSSDGTTTKCVAMLKEGASCDPSASPSLVGCDTATGLSCSSATSKCAKTATAKAGEPCDVTITCVGGATCYTGIADCKPATNDGDDCSGATSSTCLLPATCNDTTKKCTPPDYTSCK
jgi:hypothetical protein